MVAQKLVGSENVLLHRHDERLWLRAAGAHHHVLRVDDLQRPAPAATAAARSSCQGGRCAASRTACRARPSAASGVGARGGANGLRRPGRRAQAGVGGRNSFERGVGIALVERCEFRSRHAVYRIDIGIVQKRRQFARPEDRAGRRSRDKAPHGAAHLLRVPLRGCLPERDSIRIGDRRTRLEELLGVQPFSAGRLLEGRGLLSLVGLLPGVLLGAEPVQRRVAPPVVGPEDSAAARTADVEGVGANMAGVVPGLGIGSRHTPLRSTNVGSPSASKACTILPAMRSISAELIASVSCGGAQRKNLSR